MKILVDSNIVLLKESLAFGFDVAVFDGGELTPKLLKDSKAEALFVRSTTKCDSVLLDNSNIKFIGTATAGIDNIEIDYLNKHKIEWTNAAGSNSISVAEYTTLGIQSWCLENLKDISELTLGIVGFGNIGSKVGKIFENHCKQLLVSDPFIDNTKSIKAKMCELDELLSKSDIITFHTPLVTNGEHPTYRLLDAKRMELVKKEVLIINVARGGVVDESALNIVNHNPKNMIFDVWENEPNINSEFAKSLFISTPHIAGHSYEGKLRGTLNMLQSFEKYIGKPIEKSHIIDEMNSFKKRELKKLSYFELYDRLKNNIQLKDTDNKFKRVLSNFDYMKFNQMRKDYPKHNETLSEDSF